MSVDSSLPTLQYKGDFTQHRTPSSEADYLTSQRINQDPHDSLYQHTTPPEKDMENPRNQWSDIMIGKHSLIFGTTNTVSYTMEKQLTL